MKSNHKLNQDEVWEKLYLRIFFLVKKNIWTWQAVGAIFGLGGGILSIAASLILPFISILKETSFVFLILFLPLLMLGAHGLDLLEKKSEDFSASEMLLDLREVENAEFDF